MSDYKKFPTLKGARITFEKDTHIRAFAETDAVILGMYPANSTATVYTQLKGQTIDNNDIWYLIEDVPQKYITFTSPNQTLLNTAPRNWGYIWSGLVTIDTSTVSP